MNGSTDESSIYLTRMTIDQYHNDKNTQKVKQHFFLPDTLKNLNTKFFK